MRLIDADALKEMMYNEAARKANVDAVFSPYQVEFEYFDIEEYIDNAPTIEPTDNEINEAYFQGYKKGKSDERQFAERHTKAEPSGDLVSREAVVDTILETNTRLKEQTTINHLIENIDALPSADRPKGEWIVENHEVVCSICGQNNLETDFCPNCGADMRGDETNGR